MKNQHLSSALQAAVFETALDAIVMVDHAGVIVEFNPAAERIFGYKRQEAVGKEMAGLIIPPRYHQAHRNGMKRYLENGKGPLLNQLVEISAVRKDGQEFPIELSISRVGASDPPLFMGTLRDITERKSQEAELRASQAKYATTFAQAPIGIAHTSLDGRYILLNQHFCDMLGYSQTELLAKRFQDITYPEDLGEGVQALQGLIDGSRKTFDTQKRYIHKDGSLVWINLRVAVQRDDSGDPAYFLVIVENITQRKLDEAKLLEMSQLRHKADELLEINHAKDEFIALASHQLRTPATGVKQYTAMLLQGYAGDLSGTQRNMLQTAYDSNERQLDIINALLNVAQLDAGNVTLKQTDCRLDLLLKDVVNEQTEVLRTRNQTINLHLPAKPASTLADIRLLRMVLENIIDNAGKYSPAGKDIQVSLHAKPRQFVIAISDHGVGISKTDQAKLFQKFSRVDNALTADANGSGLGLYWAKKIIDLHQGSISIDSKPRQGSTFTVTLPRKKP